MIHFAEEEKFFAFVLNDSFFLYVVDAGNIVMAADDLTDKFENR